MDIELSEDQEDFRATTQRFLESKSSVQRTRELIDDERGFDPQIWAQGAELGWLSMLVSEEFGGGSVSGRGVEDLSMIMAELGKVLFPGPVLSTNLVAAAITRAGTSAQREKYLADLVAGRTIGTWAFAESTDLWELGGVETRARREGNGWVLSGTKTPVESAHVADLMLVTARADHGFVQAVVPSDASGLSIHPLRRLDLARRFSVVTLNDVWIDDASVVGDPTSTASDVEQLLALAVALQCAETIGAIDRTFAFTIEYATHRKAFGRPIGSFQALKHRFADMALWLEASKAATVAAAAAVHHDRNALEATSIAKAYVGTQAPLLVRDCLQLHGGIGFTWEHDVHLYLRRVESNRALYGSPEYHQDRLAVVVGL